MLLDNLITCACTRKHMHSSNNETVCIKRGKGGDFKMAHTSPLLVVAHMSDLDIAIYDLMCDIT